jgi:hypothetical protein
MRSRVRIKCDHCKGRILNHEPDLVLRDLDNGSRDRYYHTACGPAAYAAAAQKPSAYVLTVRHVVGIMN